MAIAHISVSVISRGQGRSAVAAAAYRARAKLYNEYEGESYDYSRKKGVVYTEISAPAHAPMWVYDQSKLWNGVELVDKASNSRLAREIEFALPKELTLEQSIKLAKEIANSFTEEGMVTDLSIHDKKDGNRHSHMMLTTRPFNPDGSWGAKAKKEYILDEDGNRIKLKSGQWKSRKIDTVDWNEDYKVEEWRERIATLINKHLELNGHDVQIDHRSYERQGIVDRIPTIHLGKAHQMEQRGIQTDRGNINRDIQEQNKQLETTKQELAELVKQREQELQQKEEEKVASEPLHGVERYKEAIKQMKGREQPTHHSTESTPRREYEDLNRRPVRERTYERTNERTIHTEYDVRKAEERYNRDMNSVPDKTSEIHHERPEREQTSNSPPAEDPELNYEQRKRQRKYERGKEPTIHGEYEKRKLEERENRKELHGTERYKEAIKQREQEQSRESPPDPHHPQRQGLEHHKRTEKEQEQNKDPGIEI